jgi:hypothetical protein
MRAVRPILDVQARWSHVPVSIEVRADRLRARDGFRLFVCPFGGVARSRGRGGTDGVLAVAEAAPNLHHFAQRLRVELVSHDPFDRYTPAKAGPLA